VNGWQRLVRSLIGGILVLTFSGCGPSAENQAELHYRLKVEVETPQGLRSGSSVIWVKAVRNPSWVNPEGRGVRTLFRGEAVSIDLPNGRTLFALLRSVSGNRDAPAEWPVMSLDGVTGQEQISHSCMPCVSPPLSSTLQLPSLSVSQLHSCMPCAPFSSALPTVLPWSQTRLQEQRPPGNHQRAHHHPAAAAEPDGGAGAD